MTTGSAVVESGDQSTVFAESADPLTPCAVAPSVEFAEFFAGIGLVREALETLGFSPAWANDIEPMKRDQYVANHAEDGFLLGDIRSVQGEQLPKGLELATSSFPCIDVSLAGKREGLAGQHSGLFWQFARIMDELALRGEAPRVILIENVAGFASSHGGRDLHEALAELNRLGYSCDIFTIDARHFVPQSRPRMFIVGIRGDLPSGIEGGTPPLSDVRPAWIRNEYERNDDLTLHYRSLPSLPAGPSDLSGALEFLDADDPRWWNTFRREAFITSLSPVQAARLKELKSRPDITWRTAYRRTRNGKSTWEIRRDGIAGCLRTTGGGSSKQALVAMGQGDVRLRWMTPLEYARLMGAGHYKLHGGTDNQALFGFGDAVVVDVIRWIGQHYLIPVIRPARPVVI